MSSIFGKVFNTSPPAKTRPAPPWPAAPWQPAHDPYTDAPMASGPSTTFSCGFNASMYINAHKGSRLSVAIAQNGIFFRDFAATT